MRHARLSILAGTAVALVMAAVPASANPVLPRATDINRQAPAAERMPSPSYRDTGSPERRARPGTFAPSEATTRSRAVTRPQVNTYQPNARIISTPGVPRAAAPAVAPAQPAQPAYVPPPVEARVAPAPAPARPIEPPTASQTPHAPAVPPVAAERIKPPTAAPVASEAVRPPAPRFSASDSDIIDKVRVLIARKQLERAVPRKNEREAVEAYYVKSQSATPLWFAGGAPSERARAAIAHLRTIADDGLYPADYSLPDLAVASADAAAEAELKFTATLLTYARHAMNGRVHFSRVSPNVEYKDNFDAADAMRQIASSGDMRRTLAGFNPQHPGYKALKAKYAELRDQPASAGPIQIASGPVLRYGRDRHGREVVMNDPRVPQLRERFGLPPTPDTRYTHQLANAVAGFQKANKLQANGQLNAATVAALNGPNREQQMMAVLATLERWRWMPRDLGRTHVALNIPDFHLRVMHNGEQVWKTRVVVGKPTQATPLLTETMKFITVNPTWNVPQSIIYNELLPIYESTDPNIFARMGLQVERRQNGEIRVFQPPGERNALGRIRFNFPNKFLVYQHDTPEKHYFAHDKRAYSHGCMRVQDPMKYAEVLLTYAAPRGNYTQANLHRMFGGEERQIDFAQHIPVHISYQTAFVDDAGKLTFREDVYGLDKAVIAQLKGSERNVADIAIERPADPNFKPTQQHVQRMQSAARGGGGSSFSLFEQLFR
jgi:L,D-transpeptidase YcbB